MTGGFPSPGHHFRRQKCTVAHRTGGVVAPGVRIRAEFSAPTQHCADCVLRRHPPCESWLWLPQVEERCRMLVFIDNQHLARELGQPICWIFPRPLPAWITTEAPFNLETAVGHARWCVWACDWREVTTPHAGACKEERQSQTLARTCQRVRSGVTEWVTDPEAHIVEIHATLQWQYSGQLPFLGSIILWR